MNTKDAIREVADLSLFVLKSYISDLDDADLMRRPTTGCNHLAYQLGHLITSEAQLLAAVAPDAAVELPADFVQHHSKENTADDNPEHFGDKQRYVELLDKVHAAALAALAKLPEADLDKPAPERFRKMFKTVGSIYLLMATHPMMHAGQFVVVRRELGKPIVI